MCARSPILERKIAIRTKIKMQKFGHLTTVCEDRILFQVGESDNVLLTRKNLRRAETTKKSKAAFREGDQKQQ